MARLTAALFALALLAFHIAPSARAADWNAVQEAARGQTVFWNAWGGDERINAYIAWVGSRVAEDYGVTLRHVKLTDTAEAVSRVLAEKTAGRENGGTIDLIWINGENFAAMKAQGLLYGPFVEQLPNHALVDFEGKPTTLIDFTVATDGLEAPWGMAKFNFVFDSARIELPPQNAAALAVWSAINRGRFTYPAPPDFLGSTFLKQALIELTEDPTVLQAEVPDEATFRAVTTPLWRYLETLHPFMWRDGASFPASGPAQRQLLNDGEIDIALSFHPSETSSLIADGQLPESARVFVFPEGTIGNTHFVAIPYNASNVEGAMVVANFLLSPEAQARKQSSEVWGDDTVLDLAKLAPDQRRLFDALPKGPATLPPDALGPVLPEPHPSWMTKIEAEWLARYSR